MATFLGDLASDQEMPTLGYFIKKTHSLWGHRPPKKNSKSLFKRSVKNSILS